MKHLRWAVTTNKIQVPRVPSYSSEVFKYPRAVRCISQRLVTAGSNVLPTSESSTMPLRRSLKFVSLPGTSNLAQNTLKQNSLNGWKVNFVGKLRQGIQVEIKSEDKIVYLDNFWRSNFFKWFVNKRVSKALVKHNWFIFRSSRICHVTDIPSLQNGRVPILIFFIP